MKKIKEAAKMSAFPRVKMFVWVICLFMVVSACSNGGTEPSSEPSPSAEAGGSTEGSSEKTQVIYWNLLGGPDGEVLLEIINEYNSLNPDVEIVSQTQDWGQYYTKLRAAVIGGNSPDLAMSHMSRVLELQDGQVIEPIDEAVDRMAVEINYSDYVSAMLEDSIIDGKRYALPFDNLLQVLYYNKKLAKEYGLADADGKLTIGKGYDEFIKALETAKGKATGEAVPMLASQSGFNPTISWFSIYNQMGGKQFLNDDRTKTAFDMDIAVGALGAIKKINEYVPPKATNVNELFMAGNGLFLIDGSWAGNSYAKALGDDFGVVPFPYLFDVETMWSDSQGFVLPVNPNRSDKVTEEALKFVKWFGENNWKWSRSGQISATKSSFESEEFKALPVVNQYTSALEKDVVSFPSTKSVWILFAPETAEPIEKMLNENVSAEDTAKEIQTRLDAVLGN
jgi:multiple sugar transport system substrate-binding protein